jgi:hypothetical protein
MSAIFCSFCGRKVIRERGLADLDQEVREEGAAQIDKVEEARVSTKFVEAKREETPTRASELDVSAAEGPSLWQRLGEHMRRSFPDFFPPMEEQEDASTSVPIWRQVLGGLRALLPRQGPTLNQTLVWILVFLLVSIAGLVFLWIWMLGSGQVVLR